MPAESRADWWKLVSILALHAAVGAVVFRYGTDLQDEGLLYAWARRILAGDLPYSDFYMVQLPGTFYLQAAFMKVFGVSILGGRIFKQLEGLAMIWLAYVAVRRATRDLTAARVAAIATAIFSCALHFRMPWYGLETCFFLVAAAWAVCLWIDTQRVRWLVAAGAALGLSTWIKQNHGVFGTLALLGVVAWHAGRVAPEGRRMSAALRASLLTCAGFTMVLGGYVAYYAAADGSLRAMWLNCFVWASEAKRHSSPVETALTPLKIFLLIHKNDPLISMAGVGWCAGVVLLMWRRTPTWLRIVAAIVLIAVASMGPGVLVRVLMFTFCGALVATIALAATAVAVREPATDASCKHATRVAAVALLALANLYSGTIPGGGWGRLSEALPATLPTFGIAAALLRSPGPIKRLWTRESILRSGHFGYGLCALALLVSTGLLAKNQAFRPSLDVSFSQMTGTAKSQGWRGLQGRADFVAAVDALVDDLRTLPADMRNSAYVFPLNCALYPLADLHNPTSFDSHQTDFLAPSQFERVRRELEESRPAVVVLHSRPNASELAKPRSWVREELWEMVEHFVKDNYRLVKRSEYFELWYLRKQIPGLEHHAVRNTGQ